MIQMKMDDNKKHILSMISAGVFALIFILLIFSPQNVDPLNTDWVTNGGGDNLQHYLGWRFFRNSPWTRYLLFMRNLDAPVGTSVIVTDSNPLCCLIFKLFRNLLPESFQFNGIWIISSYILLGVFAAAVIWCLTHSVMLSFAGVIIAVVNPVVLQRSLIHENLTAHWLILAGIVAAGSWGVSRIVKLRPAEGETLSAEAPAEGIGRAPAVTRYLGAPEAMTSATTFFTMGLVRVAFWTRA